MRLLITDMLRCPPLTIGLTLLASAGAIAQDEIAEQSAEPESREFVIFVDRPLVYEPGVDPVFPAIDEEIAANQISAPEQRQQSIQQYDAAIQAIEERGGAWDTGLIEELSALGRLQQFQGDHLSAIETFDRAMHVNRISNGLHTTNQIPDVEDLIESYIAMEDWDNADLYYNYLFYVQQKAFGTEDPRMIPVLAQLGEWHLQAFSIGYGETLGLRLSRAQILFDTAAQLVRSHFGRDDERFVPYLRNVADSAYLVSRNPQLMAEIDRPDIQNSQDILVAQLNRRGDVTPVSFRAGERALMEVVSVYEESEEDPGLLADAYANLGDWYLMFQQRRAAEQEYLKAWTLLSESGDGESQIAQLFGKVTPIPTFATEPKLINTQGSERMSPAELQEDFVDLSFAVTRNGEVRNVEIISEESSENAGQLARVARELRRFRFRPQVVDGVAVASQDNRARIRFWY